MSVYLSNLFARRRDRSPVATNPANAILTAQNHVLVPKSVFESRKESPKVLVKAVCDYVEVMTKRAHYDRNELCDMAIRVVDCHAYATHVGTVGHAGFLRQSHSDLEARLASVLFGLRTMGAHEHLMLARRMSQWVLEHADDISNESAFRNGLARTLDALDAPFADLETQTPLVTYLAEWIASHSALQVIADEDFLPVRDKVANSNPTKPLRKAAQQIERLNKMLTARPNAGISVAAGAQLTPQPLIAVGARTQVQLDGQPTDAFAVHTTGGSHWCVMTETEVSLHERAPQDPTTSVSNTLPDVGDCLVSVTNAQVTEAASIARQLNAATAVHFLLQQVPQSMSVDYVTVRSFGPDPQGDMGISLLLVLNRASAAMSAVVTEKGAVLLSEPSHEKIAAISTDMIREYARKIRPVSAA